MFICQYPEHQFLTLETLVLEKPYHMYSQTCQVTQAMLTRKLMILQGLFLFVHTLSIEVWVFHLNLMILHKVMHISVDFYVFVGATPVDSKEDFIKWLDDIIARCTRPHGGGVEHSLTSMNQHFITR